jgi:quinol monooxygenase YgiN
MRFWIGTAAAALTGCTGVAPRVQRSSQLDADADRSQRVVLISRIKPKAGAEREIEAAISEFYVAVRRDEPGCLMNAMHRPAGPPGNSKGRSNDAFAVTGSAPTVLVFYEVYRDSAAARQHTSTPHFHALMSRIGSLMNGPIELEFLQELDRV